MTALAAVLILVFWLFSRNPEWRQFSWQQVWSLLIHANPVWLTAAVAFTYASYVIRAYRWKFFLDPLKPASLRVLFTGQILGFSSVYLIGRPGELVRPAYIARWEGVPFASQFAILVLERLCDMVAMAVVFGLALYLEPVRHGGAETAHTLHRMHEVALWVLAGTAGLVVTLVLFRFRANKLINWAGRRLRFLPARIRRGLAGVARSFAEGLDVIQNWRDLAASVVCTALLWVVNVSVYWFVFQSLGGALGELSWWTGAVVAFSAGVGLLFQLPGVGGGFQVAVLSALTKVFHIHAAAATGAALLEWIVLFVPCAALAAVLLIYGGLSFRKLHAMAQAEREAVSRDGARESG